MSDIQKDKKIALKGSSNEVIQSNLIPLDLCICSQLINSENKLKVKLRLKRPEFTLLFLLVSTGQPMYHSQLSKIISLGYTKFYIHVNSLEKKGLIGIYKQDKKIMYFATIKAYQEFSQFYPSFKFQKPKIGQLGD